jgi:deoxyribodipyrimidine photo-lyase
VATPCTVVWLRRDLRLADNPALAAAADRGRVVPVYVWSPQEEGDWSPGSASRWWLHHSLQALDRDLRERGSRLLLRRGPAARALADLAQDSGADAVYWNRLYDPLLVERDATLERDLRALGLDACSHAGGLFNEPNAIRNRQGTPFKVFTPFYKHCSSLGAPRRPRPRPVQLVSPRRWPRGCALAELALLPDIDWAHGLREAWQPGEAGALRELDRFADADVEHYAEGRERPDICGVSRLSPHLHFGEVSPHFIWHTLAARWPGRAANGLSASVEPYVRQLYWREFAHHLLLHFPHTVERPLAPAFACFPWRDDEKELQAWRHGRTGYPLVDAGMRELWATGWMHNRVRMNVASFLVKHLLGSWTHGARWFWDTLVDADLANNTMGWQWAAGCGADAAPYFRIFNPIRQGERFDPTGAYVRRWVPELAELPATHIHAPWNASARALADAGVRLGQDYPRPLVDHAEARRRALEALARSRGNQDSVAAAPPAM